MSMLQSALHSLLDTKDESSKLRHFVLYDTYTVQVYPLSIHHHGGTDFFIGRTDHSKLLYAVGYNSHSMIERFHGVTVLRKNTTGAATIFHCPLSHDNAKVLRELFVHTRPQLIGIENSFGLGDRIGLANPGHIRPIRNSGFRPILAQQSIRELKRTNRTPEEVIDAATWAVFQEGYRDGYGADADHLKTTDDIDLMVRAGFTMFTIDPSDYVVNEASDLSESELKHRASNVLWEVLQDTFDGVVARYLHRSFAIHPSFTLSPTIREILQAIVKYGNVLAHVVRMHNHLKAKYPEYPSELEVSVDETDSPTTPFEHFFIANELKRVGVKLVSLAPRFVGHFEKGIDYRGDIHVFIEEYEKHVAIAEMLGPYKLSIHSGSDKFAVYRAIGTIGRGRVHVKTAGTSYLEGLKVVALKDPELFRSIFNFSAEQFEQERQTYHVSGRLDNVPRLHELNDSELVSLFEIDDARQVLHVAFGKVLTSKDETGNVMFKDKIISCLLEHEDLHYQFLEKHFLKHVEPFRKGFGVKLQTEN